MDLMEKKMMIKITGNASLKWYFDLTIADGVKLPFEAITIQNLEGNFEGMKYNVKAETGSFSRPNNGAVLRISPRNNTIALDF